METTVLDVRAMPPRERPQPRGTVPAGEPTDPKAALLPIFLRARRRVHVEIPRRGTRGLAGGERPGQMTVARLPFMALAGLSLLAALGGGLIRLGWPLPLVPTLPPNHGPLLVTGFLGTLIGLERAVALKRRWPYGAPLLSGLGGPAPPPRPHPPPGAGPAGSPPSPGSTPTWGGACWRRAAPS